MNSTIISSDDKHSDKIYKIGVLLCPINNEYQPDKPFFWCLSSCAYTDDADDSDWCTENVGWSESPQEAFNEAYSYYRRYYDVQRTS